MLIYCPSCRNQLRVQHEFIGRKVRCPMCNGTFEATAELPVTDTPPSGQGQEVDYNPSADPLGRRRREYEDDYDDRPRRRREKPGKVQAIAIMTLIGGILATLGGLGVILYLGVVGIATAGIGLLCCLWPGPYFSVILGIMAIVKGSQLLGKDDWKQRPPKTIAIMQIINVINFDVTNCVLGILTLVFLSEPEVRRYYRG